MNDLISRQALCEYALNQKDKSVTPNDIMRFPSAQPEQQWIPCSERLPEDDTEVLVYLFDRTSPYIAWVTDCCWFTEDFEVEKENYPTAWMPLPIPYKEGQDGER